MPRCTKIRRKKRKLCIGDLDTEIILQDRVLTEPLFNSVDFDEIFTATATVLAMVNTVSGKTFFDGVNNVDVGITHEIGIRFDATVTSETWIELNGQRIDILDTNNLEERNEWLILTCVSRGLITKEASKT